MKQKQNGRYAQLYFTEGDLALKPTQEAYLGHENIRSMRQSSRLSVKHDVGIDYELEQMRRQRTRRYALERERRLESERRRLAEEEARQTQEKQYMAAHQHRRRRALSILFVTLVLAGFSYLLLCRQANLEKKIILQNEIRSQIKSETKQVEELQVQLNRKGNIEQIQEYARTNLSMDYPLNENMRRISLP